MALILIILIISIGLGVVGSLYASIIPFIDKLGSVANYNIAYYGAMMSAERGLLALRHHDAGFEGKSGLTEGHLADAIRQRSPSFGRFTQDSTTNAYWQITSRVQGIIPAPGKGNVEALFAHTDSKNYNSLDYSEGLVIPLYLDNDTSSNDYYYPTTSLDPLDTGGDPISLKGRFRLPPKVNAGLGSPGVDTIHDIDDDNIDDDIIVARGLQGRDFAGDSFSIFPTIKNDFARREPFYSYDNALRESVIREGDDGNDNIDTSEGVGFSLPVAGSLVSKNNILPLGSPYSGMGLNDILLDATEPTLTFAITNRIQTNDGNIFPFLEWQIKVCGLSSCDIPVSDRFFTLRGVGVVKDYTVQIVIKKPVKKSTNTANFTIIF